MDLDIDLDNLLYVFVDPFSSDYSGVSSYVTLANELLTSFGVTCQVIRREDGESIDLFRRRLPKELDKFYGRVVIEAPETLAATKFVPDDIDIHIRLHCSQSLGAAIQGIKYQDEDVREEQIEISRAKWVSSPSNISVSAAKWIFSLPEKVFVYPNAMPNSILRDSSFKRGKVAFVGRWQELKGISFVKKIVALLPDVEFVLGVDRDPCIRKKNVSWVLVDSNEKKNAVFDSADMLILPSLFETASMVGLEAISRGLSIVCWEHLGIAEYFDDELVRKIEIFNEDQMSAAVRKRIALYGGDFTAAGKINSSYVDGWRSVIMGVDHDGTLNPCLVDFPEILEKTLEICRYSTMERFKRKVKKLLTNPRRFLVDSRFLPLLFMRR